MKKIYVFLADGFEEIEAISSIDILRRAELDVVTVSISDNYEVVGAHNITVLADKLFADVDYSDNEMLLLPGGGVGTQNLDAHQGLSKLLTEQAEKGKNIAAICAAPSVLGRLGILVGKEAICYPGFEQALAGATISSLPVVEDGNVITGKGPAFAIPFALELVKKLKGEAAVEQVSSAILLK